MISKPVWNTYKPREKANTEKNLPYAKKILP
jgi:hypothetical protein